MDGRNTRLHCFFYIELGVAASCLVRSPPDQALQIRTLTGDIMLCFQARQFTYTVHVSTQVYRWALVNVTLGR